LHEKKGITKNTVVISSFVIAGPVQHSLLMHISEGHGGYGILRGFVLPFNSGLCTEYEPSIPQLLWCTSRFGIFLFFPFFSEWGILDRSTVWICTVKPDYNFAICIVQKYVFFLGIHQLVRNAQDSKYTDSTSY